MMGMHEKENKPKKSHQVLTLIRNNGKKESKIIKFKRIHQREKNLSLVSLKCVQNKMEENVFKIFTAEVCQTTHHKYA